MRWLAASLVALLATSSSLYAQAELGYSAAQLACASFRQSIRSDLTIQTAGRTASANSGREGHLNMATIASPTPPRMLVVAWFDSLRAWRSAGGNRIEPDASGVLGGRYRGELLPDGSIVTQVVPFVPEAVREVTELAGVLDDMLPRLPPWVIQVGEEWRSGDSLAIKRLSDSTNLQRYRIQLTREGLVPPPPGDTLTPTYSRTLNDRGIAAWDPMRGPVRYDHAITVEARVPAGGAIKSPARSLVEQQVLLERRADPPPATCPASLFAEY